MSFCWVGQQWLHIRVPSSAGSHPSLSTSSKGHFVGCQSHDRTVLLVQGIDSSRFLALPFHVHARKTRHGPELRTGNLAQRAKEGAGDDFEPCVQDIEYDGCQPECQTILGAVGGEHGEPSPVVDESANNRKGCPAGELRLYADLVCRRPSNPLILQTRPDNPPACASMVDMPLAESRSSDLTDAFSWLDWCETPSVRPHVD
jgi:hypothetical protein